MDVHTARAGCDQIAAEPRAVSAEFVGFLDKESADHIHDVLARIDEIGREPEIPLARRVEPKGYGGTT